MIFLKQKHNECFIYGPIFDKKDWMATFLPNICFDISVKNMRLCHVVQSWEGCVYMSLFTSRGQRRNIIAGERCEHVITLFVLNCKAASLRWKEWNANSSSHSCVAQDQYLTVDPADTNGLKYGHKQQTHPAGSVRVKELEDVHPSLIGRDRCQFCCQRLQMSTRHNLSNIWNASSGF